MNKLTLTSLLAISIVAPAFAAVGDKTINAGASSAPCTNTTLDTTTGPAALEADWSANTITINWDAKNGTTIPSSDCTYDDTITLPATPSKTGYTFGGWTVKSGPAQCSLTGLDTSKTGSDMGYIMFDGTASTYHTTYPGGPVYQTPSYFNLTENGTWAVEFEYGSVKGTAYCSAKSGNDHIMQYGGDSSDWTATESELTSATGDAKYCWCKVTGYTPNGGDMCVPVASSWVFHSGRGSSSDCADSCVNLCGDLAHRNASFRAAVFGQSN